MRDSSHRDGLHAAIVGISGPVLRDDEAVRFAAFPPAGVILFGRNVVDPIQLGALVARLRTVLPSGAVLMVDQEGGRVARLRPPHWPAHPAAAAFGLLFQGDPEAGVRAAWLHGALIGSQVASAGFDVACAPMLDIRNAGASTVVGDRALADNSHAVAALGAAMASGLLAAGVQPVPKHAPGHGRALVDSHLALPSVDAVREDELIPFRACAEFGWMMTAHVLYSADDPDHPATLSARIIGHAIRERIGFQGVLVSDDLAMGALSGDPAERAARAIAAGCDIALYCPGDAAGTDAVLRTAPPLSLVAQQRLAGARAMAADRQVALDIAAMENERSALLA